MSLFNFSSWLRQAFPRSNRKNKQAAQAKRTTLNLESLEDRLAPATITGSNYAGANLTPSNGDILQGTFTNVGTFDVAAGTTVYVAPGTPLSVTANTIHIDGVLDGDGAGYAGGANGQSGSPGSGPGGGQGGTYGPAVHASGGGGGGYGGAGGNGAWLNAGGTTQASGGSAYGTAAPLGVQMGSGGGGAGDHDPSLTGTGGPGGAGGGGISLMANQIYVTGTITDNGANGQQGTLNGDSYSVSGGGGGSGGGIELDGGVLYLSGALAANGGGGANFTGPTGYYGHGGGGGGGGRIKLTGSEVLDPSFSESISGGAPGTSDTNTTDPATAGAAGSFADTTTPAVPTISSLNPTSAAEGATSFTLTVNGSNYASNATVDWNGTALATTFVSDTQLTATVPTADLAEEGSANITVVNPSQSETSAAQTFTVNDAPLTATAVAVNAAEGAAVTNAEVATFTDADPNAVAADYTATVAWGDGETSPGTVTLVSGVFQVTASKPDPYAEEGPRTVTVTIFDTDVGNTTNESWTSVASLPAPRAALGVVEGSDGRLYAVGGYDNTGAGFSSSVSAYTPSTNAWTPVASMSTPREEFGVAAGLDGRIYAIGGKNSSGTLSSVEAYTPGTNSWAPVASLPTALSDFATATGADGRIYVIGGVNESGNVESEVYAYTPATNQWAQVAGLPTDIAYLAAATGADGTIYAIGGYEPGVGYTNTVYAYTPSTNTWAPVASMPTVQANLAATTGADGLIYAIGGDSSGGRTNTVYVYTPSTNTWAQVASLSAPGDYLGAATGADGRVYVVGGYDANGHSTTIVETLGVPRSTATTTSNIDVSDPAVIATAGPQISAVEGGSTNLVVLASFTDPGGAEALSEYDATVNWGDNTTADNTTDANPNIFIVQSGSGFLVEGTHVYGVESPAGGFTVTTTIHHHSEGAPNPVDTVVNTQMAIVTDPAVSATGGFTVTAMEGTLSTSQTVATFTDPAGAESDMADYSATINWGDGTTADTATPGNGIALNGGVFTVSGDHQYAEEGTYTVSVTIAHGTAPNVSGTSTALVADAALTAGTLTVPTATEGAAFGPTTVFQFTDGNTAATAADFTATVDTGDSTLTSAADPNQVQVVATGGGFDVNLSYTYAEELTNGTFSVNVLDDGGQSASQSGSITVADAAMTITAVTPPESTAVEGASTGTVTVATFTDADPAGTASDYHAVITWGDGTTSTGAIVDNGNGTFGVTGAHTYAQDGVTGSDFVVTVTDKGGASNQLDGGLVAVTDAKLTLTQIFPPAGVTEGASTGTVVLATFRDADPNGAAGDYIATVNWGDGDSNTSADGSGTVTVQADPINGGFQVLGSHTYLEELANQTFSVSVSERPTEVAAPGSADDPLGQYGDSRYKSELVHEVSKSMALVTAIDVLAFGPYGGGGGSHIEAAPVGSKFSYLIVNPNDGAGYAVMLGVVESTGFMAQAVVNVADPAVSATGGFTITATEGADSGSQTVATFTDPGGAELVAGQPDPAEYSALVNWGDGTAAAAGTLSYASGTVTVSGSHKYAEEGTYTVSVLIQHGTAPNVSVTSTAVVSDPPIQYVGINAIATGAYTEGQPIGPQEGLASFTDPGGQGDENASDFTATIHWNDTTTSAGTVVSMGNGAYRVDAPDHTYAEDGVYHISVSVTHDQTGVTVTSGTTDITIGEAALTTPVVATINAVEGTATGPITGLATFSDLAGAGTATDTFTATINWGDSLAIDANATVVALGGGAYRVDATAGHTYADDGRYNITVSVTHDDVTTPVTGTGAALVADPQITNLAYTAPTTGNEGTDVGATAQAVATFTDPAGYGQETAADFTATVNWGDGSQSAGVVTQAGGAGQYDVTVASDHAYSEEGNYTLSVTVQHDALAPLTVSHTVAVADQQISTPVIVAASLPAGAKEGVALAPITDLATFNDPAGVGKETVNDFAATIDWGDNTTSTGTVVSLGGGNYQVNAPSHTYVAENAAGYAVNVTVRHDQLTALTTAAAGTIVVADQPVSTPVVNALNAVEGTATGSITGLATFSDPAGTGSENAATDFSATINWGDGHTDSTADASTTVQVVSLGNGLYRVDSVVGHIYAEDGTKTITVTVTHDALTAVSGTGAALVADPQITNLAYTAPTTGTEGADVGATAQAVATFTDPAGYGQETASDFTATVNWGDGSQSAGVVTQAGGAGQYDVTVAADHAYSEEGNYTLSVTVQHDALAPLTVSHTVAVADQQVTVTNTAGSLPATIQIGQPTGPVSDVARINDPAGAGKETAADFAATIHWGDNTTSPGTVVSLGGGNYRVDAPSHTYTRQASNSVSVTVQHDGLTAVASSGSALNVNVTPTYAAAVFPGSGVWRYVNTGAAATTGLTQLTAAIATVAAADGKGDVYADFQGYGLDGYGTSGGWSAVNPPSLPPGTDASLVAADAAGDVTAAYQGYGVYRRLNGSTVWQPLTSSNASLLAMDSAGNVYADLSGSGMSGTYELTGPTTDKLLTPKHATLLAADGKGDVFADFAGYGINEYTGSPTWTPVSPPPVSHGLDASLLAVDAGGDVAAAYTGAYAGLYAYTASTSSWQLLTPSVPSQLSMPGFGEVFAEFPGYGLLHYTAAAGFQQLTLSNPTTLAKDAKGDVFAVVSGQGLFRSTLGGPWQQVHPVTPSLLAVDANGDVAVMFQGYGVYREMAGAGWQRLTLSTASLLAIDANGDVYADLSGSGMSGTYELTGPTTDKRLTPNHANLLAVDGNGDVFADLAVAGYGLQELKSGAAGFGAVNPAGVPQSVDATLLAVDANGDVAAAFPNHGVYRMLAGGSWQSLIQQANTGDASLLAIGGAGDVFVQFKLSTGVDRYTSPTVFARVVASNATLLTDDLNGDVFADFPTYGFYSYTATGFLLVLGTQGDASVLG